MFFEDARPVINPISPGPIPDLSESVKAGYEEQRRFGSVYGLEIDYREKFTSQLQSFSEATGKEYSVPFGTRSWLNSARKIQGEEVKFNGDIDKQTFEELQQINRDILEYKTNNPQAEFFSLEEIYNQVLEDDRQKQAEFDDLAARGNFSNSVANFIGSMGGSFSFERDPLNVATLGISGAGKTLVTRLASEAGVNGVVEGLNQITGVAENDRLRNRDKNLEDYLLSIGATAAGAAFIKGGLELGSAGFSRVRNGPDYGFLNDVETEDIDNVIRAFESKKLSDDDILNRIRQAESNGGDPRFQQNPNSSASGDFQFIDSTWERMVNKYGDELGVKLADKSDPKSQRLMAQKLLEENRSILISKGVKNPTSGDMYVAHFAGPNRAAKLIKLRNSDKPASEVFPKKVIDANKNIYKNKDGSLRSLKEVYGILVGKVGEKPFSKPLASMNPVERNLELFERTMDETNPLHRGIKHNLEMFDHIEKEANPLPDITAFQRFHDESMENALELLESKNDFVDVPPIELLPSAEEIFDFSQDAIPERIVRSQQNIVNVAERQQQVQDQIAEQSRLFDDLIASKGERTESFFENPDNISSDIQRISQNNSPELEAKIRDVRKKLSNLEQQSRNLENEYVNRWNRLSNQIAKQKFDKVISNYQPTMPGDPPSVKFSESAYEAVKTYGTSESSSIANALNEFRADDNFIQQLKSESAFKEFAEEIENGLNEADIEEEVFKRMNECVL